GGPDVQVLPASAQPAHRLADLAPLVAAGNISSWPGWLVLLPPHAFVVAVCDEPLATAFARAPAAPGWSLSGRTFGWHGRWLAPKEPVPARLLTLVEGAEASPGLILAP